MSVLRKFNWLGQMRVDIPHLKALESSVTADFDLLAGQIGAGYKPLVVKGFDLVDAANAVGKVASSLQLNVAGGILINYYASEAGSMFFCPSAVGYQALDNSNSRVSGAFVAGTTNYVGIDLVRSDDFTGQFPTTDTVKFLDIVSRSEVSRQVPIGRLLDFKIIISTQEFEFTPAIIPLMKVVTSSANAVTSVEDARYSPFRLARGGSYPDTGSSFGWAQGRDESVATTSFIGGDKAITSMKDWQDAVMTRIWEIGGGKYWYSPTADRNVRLTRTGTTFSNGEWFEWDGTHLHWRGLRMVFDNSGGTVWYNTITDQLTDSSGNYGALATNLADGDCLYVDIVRTSAVSPVGVKKGLTAQLGVPTIPGTRFIIAWRVGTQVFTRDTAFPVGVTFTVATNTNLGLVQLTYAAGNPSIPLVAPQNANGSILNTATVLGNVGFGGTGLGSGAGVTGQGGTSNGSGIVGTGGATNGVGGVFTGAGNAAGVTGAGGTNSGPGGVFSGGATNGYGVSGIGAGTGAGVIAAGQNPAYGLDALGGLAGARILNRAAGSGPAILARSANLYPVLKAVAGAGDYTRATIDHNGYRMGQVTEIYEPWDAWTSVSTAGGTAINPENRKWTTTVSAASGAGSLAPAILSSNTEHFNMLSITAGTTENDTTGLYMTKNCFSVFGYSSKIVYVAEFIACGAAGTGNGTKTFGLSNFLSGGTLDDQDASIAFVKRSGDTNWWTVIRVADAFVYNNDSGIAPLGTTSPQVFRIEISGTTVNFYIDGVLAGTAASVHPTGTAMRIAAAVSRVTASGSLNLGPVRMCWNNMENPPGSF